MLTEDRSDQANLLSYLLSHGHVDGADVVAGKCSIADHSRRNQNFRVHLGSRGLIVKRARDEGAAETLAREAATVERLEQVSGLAPYLPRLRAYDRSHDMLVSELLDDAQPLSSYLTRRRLPLWVARAMGMVLGRLHTISVVQPSSRWHRPWILHVHRLTPEAYGETSSANLHLIRAIQTTPGFREALERLAEDLHVDAITHGDVKWDNWVVSRRPNRRLRLSLVDWELAQTGSAAWDVGSALHDYLVSWIFSIPIEADTPPPRFAELADRPLDTIRPSITALWDAYARIRRAGRPSSVMAVRCAGARLVQSAYEHSQFANRLNAHSVLLLQLAHNILSRPREAALHLFGLRQALLDE